MFSVGLTGNVASGKSTVARLFAAWGATVIDADALVREVEAPGSPVLHQLAAHFGERIIRADGQLDRPRLRELMTADPDARAALEDIVHPAVGRRRDELMKAARERGVDIVVHDIPLLFEALDPDQFDLIVLVDAPPDVRRDRLISGRQLTPAEADRLMATQLPPDYKRARSDIVIENEGSMEQLETAARKAWETVRRQATAARRTREVD